MKSAWRKVKLGEVCDLIGETVNPQQNKDEMFAHYSILAFDDGRKCVMETGENILSNKTEFPNGAVLFSKLNPRIPRVWLVNDSHDKRRICSTEFLPLIPRDELNSEFLVFALQEPQTISILRGGVQAATKSRERLKPELVLKAALNLPPVEEQRRIAGRLREQMAAVEKARAAVEQQLDAAQKLPAALLRAVFTSPAAQRWPRRKLGELLTDCRNGLYKPVTFYGRGTPILKMFNIGRLDGRWELENVDRIEVTTEEHEQFGLRTGDIMFNRVNSRELVGKCAVVDGKTSGAVFESKNMRLRLNDNLADSRFVATFLNSQFGRAQIERRTRQIIGMATVNRSDLESFEIILPGLAEQKGLILRLETELAAARSLCRSLEKRLAEVELLPAALLREAFNPAG